MKKISRRNEVAIIDPGKSHCQKIHAKKRARQRAGIDLSDQLIAQIVSCIKKQKDSTEFQLTYIEEQSKRLIMYEIIFPDKGPINFIYDKFRGTIVTFLYPEDANNIYHYYDVFKNKVNVKSEYGQTWRLKGDQLEITGEVVSYADGVWEITEGVMRGKRFILDDGEMIEIM